MKRFFFVILLFSFYSCESSIDIELNGESKLVVEAYLISGDSIKVRVSSSADIKSRNPKNIEDLSFYILFNEQKYKLIYRDFDHFSSIYTLPISTFSIPNNGLLRFEAHYKNQVVSSNASVPKLTKIDSFNIDFTRNNIGTIEVKSIDIYADFPVENELYLIELEIKQRVLYKNTVINHSAIILRKYSEPNSNSKQIHIKNSISTGFGYYASALEESFVLNLYTLDSFYSEFYKAINSQRSDGDGLGSIFGNNVTEVPTNVKNGYGIFTIMNPDTMRMEVK